MTGLKVRPFWLQTLMSCTGLLSARNDVGMNAGSHFRYIWQTLHSGPDIPADPLMQLVPLFLFDLPLEASQCTSPN